jgi:hypothetical protein
VEGAADGTPVAFRPELDLWLRFEPWGSSALIDCLVDCDGAYAESEVAHSTFSAYASVDLIVFEGPLADDFEVAFQYVDFRADEGAWQSASRPDLLWEPSAQWEGMRGDGPNLDDFESETFYLGSAPPEAIERDRFVPIVLEAGKTYQIAISFDVEVGLASTSGCATCSLVGGLTFDAYRFELDGFSLSGGPAGATLTSEDGVLVQGVIASDPPEPLSPSLFFVPEPGSTGSIACVATVLGWARFRRGRYGARSTAARKLPSM